MTNVTLANIYFYTCPLYNTVTAELGTDYIITELHINDVLLMLGVLAVCKCASGVH